MSRAISLGEDGFTVADDRDGVLGRFLTTIVMGEHANQIESRFAPDGEGFWIPSIGGALRVEDRESLRPPYDEDPALDPANVELWAVERDRPPHAPLQVVLTGDELRALLTEAQRIAMAR